MLTDGQISITRPDGTALTLHHGTPYRANDFNPFHSRVRAGQGGPVPFGDGTWGGAEFRDATTIPLRLRFAGSGWAELMDLYWPIRAALAPVGTGPECELRWNAAGTEYLMYVRPRDHELDHQRTRTGRGRVTAELYATDPTIYSGIEYVTQIGPYRLAGGLPTPFTLPAPLYATPSDGVATLTNEGTAPARLDLTIPGPSLDPYITVTGPSGVPETLFFDLELGEDDVLTVNTQTQDVTLNGSASRLWAAFGDWPLLAPRSTSTLEYRSANESGPSMTIRHRWTY